MRPCSINLPFQSIALIIWFGLITPEVIRP